jgi:hypothetical protein
MVEANVDPPLCLCKRCMCLRTEMIFYLRCMPAGRATRLFQPSAELAGLAYVVTLQDESPG